MTAQDSGSVPRRQGAHPRDASGYPPIEGPLKAVNEDFHTSYARLIDLTKERLGQPGQPVMILMGDHVIFLHDGKSETAQIVPDEYHRLKALSHLAFGSYVSLLTFEPGPLGENEREVLGRKIDLVEDALDSLRDGELADEFVETQRSILESTLDLLATAHENGSLDSAAPTDYARRIAPLLLESGASAARMELDRLHDQVSSWRKTLSDQAWRSLYVVICAGHQSRYRETSKQYFQRLLGEQEGLGAEHEDRVIYAEGISDQDLALELLAEHIIDQRASLAFFMDRTRLQQDLLADATEAYLNEILPVQD